MNGFFHPDKNLETAITNGLIGLLLFWPIQIVYGPSVILAIVVFPLVFAWSFRMTHLVGIQCGKCEKEF